MTQGDSTARRLHQRAARVIGCVHPPGACPGAVAALAAAVAASSLLLAGCAAGAGTQRAAGTTTQQEAISRALVAAGGRQIVVPYTAGGCVQGARLTATETASRVTLVLRQIVSGSICPADLAIGTASVTLRRPLWGRSLADGTAG